MKISCIIVDDEPLSQDVLKKYIAETPQLDLRATLENAIQAMEYMNKNFSGFTVPLLLLSKRSVSLKATS